MPQDVTGYLHGYSEQERERLRHQAAVLAPWVHDRLPYRRRRRLLEVGSGVGAQTEILLRQFPELSVTGVEINDDQLAEAKRFLATVPGAAGRYTFIKGDATQLDFEAQRDLGELGSREAREQSFDSAFLCWVLEHVGDPARVLSEVRRVLVPGSPIVCSEVLNATFFVDPYSPHTVRYWNAFNEHQLAVGGDPFVGAKLGNLLQSVGFQEVQTEVKSIHLDNRDPVDRAEILAYVSDLLLSGAPALLAAKQVDQQVVDGMRAELARVARDPNAVFFYAFIQARAVR